mgnify:CR=1 FL=1
MRRRRWRSYIQVCCFLLLGLLLIPSEVYAQLPKKSQIVVFVPEGGLFLVTPDDKKVRHLTRDLGLQATDPTWSPDGKNIAFNKGKGICVMDTNGKNQTMLTNEQAQDWWPAWSPDGEKIAFISDRDGNDEVYIMDADGSNQKRLTDNPDPDGFPDWTSDGKIIFGRGAEVYIMDSDGKNQKMLIEGAVFPDWLGPSPGQGVEADGKLNTTWGNIKLNH